MEFGSLLDKSLKTIWLFRAPGVHPAWVDEFTLPIVGYDAFLELADGELLRITACEIDLGTERYPGLGLSLERCNANDLKFVARSGDVVNAVQLTETASFLPSPITGVEESDPLGQDTISELRVTTYNGLRIVFRHIFPPLTLGIEVQNMAETPNYSFKATSLRDAP